MSTCNRLDLGITRILTDYAQKLPGHCTAQSPLRNGDTYTRRYGVVLVVVVVAVVAGKSSRALTSQ